MSLLMLRSIVRTIRNAARWSCLCLLAGAFLSACGPITFTVGTGLKQQELEATEVVAPERSTRDRVAMIDVTGVIINADRQGILSTSLNPVSDLREKLTKATQDPNVKAVILRLNTPGGGVSASDMMYREVVRFRESTGRPVVVMMMDVAASGGYYLACGADEIVAHPTSVTGSIGVVLQTFSIKPALDRWGVQSKVYKSGPNKDAGSPFADVTPSHEQVLQGIVDEYYANFRSLVRTSRPDIPADAFDRMTDGRVVTGEAALENGLVDYTGDMITAFERAKALAGISDAKLVLYHRGMEYVATPYSQAPAPGGTQINLAQFNLGAATGLDLPAGFYYLWQPQLSGE